MSQSTEKFSILRPAFLAWPSEQKLTVNFRNVISSVILYWKKKHHFKRKFAVYNRNKLCRAVVQRTQVNGVAVWHDYYFIRGLRKSLVRHFCSILFGDFPCFRKVFFSPRLSCFIAFSFGLIVKKKLLIWILWRN